MGQKQAKRTRRASRHVQTEFKRMGLTEREFLVRQTLKSQFFQLALRQKIGDRHFTQIEKPELSKMVIEILQKEGIDLRGLTINVGRNDYTGALILQCDATPESQSEAIEAAKKRLAVN